MGPEAETERRSAEVLLRIESGALPVPPRNAHAKPMIARAREVIAAARAREVIAAARAREVIAAARAREVIAAARALIARGATAPACRQLLQNRRAAAKRGARGPRLLSRSSR